MFSKRQQKNFREKVDYIHSLYFHQLLIKLIEVIFFYLKINAISTRETWQFYTYFIIYHLSHILDLKQ